MALTADRWTRGKAATLTADAFAVRVETSGDAVRGITWRNTRTGQTQTEEAKVVVLAGGPLETPRLWLNSGLPNPNDQVGRGLTDHYLDFVVGRFNSYTGSSKGPTSAARLDFPGYGGLEQAGVMPGLQAQGLVGERDGSSAEPLKRFMRDVDKLIGVAVITDDDVHPANRVDLSPTMAPDAHGPVARLSIRARTQRTLRNRDYLAGRAVELLRAAGARQIVRANFPALLLHLHSTMRMGVNESRLGARCERGVPLGQAPLRRGQLRAAERARRAESDADDAGARDADGREDLRPLLRRRAVGRARVTGVVCGRLGDCGCYCRSRSRRARAWRG